jgi:hypothetical protein
MAWYIILMVGGLVPASRDDDLEFIAVREVTVVIVVIIRRGR